MHRPPFAKGLRQRGHPVLCCDESMTRYATLSSAAPTAPPTNTFASRGTREISARHIVSTQMNNASPSSNRAAVWTNPKPPARAGSREPGKLRSFGDRARRSLVESVSPRAARDTRQPPRHQRAVRASETCPPSPHADLPVATPSTTNPPGRQGPGFRTTRGRLPYPAEHHAQRC